ncbi:MAG: DUF4097 family beta strand repeat-containing protein [Bacteroidota bacterium]|jgi:hypothetical protein
MNEELLQRLFTDLRNSPAETSIEDVSRWVNDEKVDFSSTDSAPLLTKSKIILMTASITIIITGAIVFLTPQRNQTPDKTNLSPIPVNKELYNLPVSPENNEKPSYKKLPVKDSSLPTTYPGPAMHQIIPIPIVSSDDKEDIKATSEGALKSQINTILAPINKSQGSITTSETVDTSGVWTTNSKMLTIDTIFSGVTELVLTGKYPSQISIEGSERDNIAFNYQYDYQIKGIYTGKKSGSTVAYKKSGSTLFISVENREGVMVGVFTYGKVISNVSLTLPKNITVRVNSSYGDIIAKQLSGASIELNTKYGDVEAQSLIGNVNLQSGYGDITLHEANGKVNLSTKYGDIKAYKIKADESLQLSSGYGDIDCRLLSKEEACRLNLSTGFGKISVKGNEVDIESTKKIQIGKGSTTVSASSSFGDVKIRFVEL